MASVQSHYDEWLASAKDLLAANDFAGAKRLAEQAMQSNPLHPDHLVDRILAVADVLLAAPDDHRSVLQLNPSPPSVSSSTAEIVSSYRRLSLLLLLLRDADLPSASRARDLVSRAYSSALSKQQQEPPVAVHAFWTLCPRCRHVHQYASEHVGKELRCPKCAEGFVAVEMAAPPEVVEGTDMYRCAWGFFPVGPPAFAASVPPPQQQRRGRAKPTAMKRKILWTDYGDDDCEEDGGDGGQGG